MVAEDADCMAGRAAFGPVGCAATAWNGRKQIKTAVRKPACSVLRVRSISVLLCGARLFPIGNALIADVIDEDETGYQKDEVIIVSSIYFV